MTKTQTPRCFFLNCRQPVLFTVQRLWAIKGQLPPVQYCCDKHIPGSATAQAAQTASRFYRVEPIIHAS